MYKYFNNNAVRFSANRQLSGRRAEYNILLYAYTGSTNDVIQNNTDV